MGRKPDLGGSTHTASSGERAAHLLATGRRCFHPYRVVVARAANRDPGHCARRGLHRAESSFNPDPMPDSLTFCGRTFHSHELELMSQIAVQFSALGITEIARTVCELLEWKRPNGGLKNHECRQLLERLATEGVLKLPELRRLGGRGPRRIVTAPVFEPEPVECSLNECGPLQLILVEGKAESRLWRELVERHHYLGCRVPFGAHLRYFVRDRERELACLLWTSPAWKMEPRDACVSSESPGTTFLSPPDLRLWRSRTRRTLRAGLH